MTNFKIQISMNVIYHLLYDDTIICGCLSTKSEAFNRTLIDWGLIQTLNGNQKLRDTLRSESYPTNKSKFTLTKV